MLTFLRDSGKAGNRKLRMLALAGMRAGGYFVTDPAAEQGIAVVEKLAEEGEATEEEVNAAFAAARGTPLMTALYTFLYRPADMTVGHAARSLERETQCDLLRDLFGPLPFREVRIETAWLTPAVSSIARRAYDERDFSALPVLADALADAGCDDEDLLRHCRERGLVHCRGCWVVDLLLGRS